MNSMALWLTYEFTVCRYEARWRNVAGIYIFAGLNQNNQWTPYYIGQCDSFQNRIPSHEKWDMAQSLGATHVHAMEVQPPQKRDSIEKVLIEAFHPPLNYQGQ